MEAGLHANLMVDHGGRDCKEEESRCSDPAPFSSALRSGGVLLYGSDTLLLAAPLSSHLHQLPPASHARLLREPVPKKKRPDIKEWVSKGEEESNCINGPSAPKDVEEGEVNEERWSRLLRRQVAAAL